MVWMANPGSIGRNSTPIDPYMIPKVDPENLFCTPFVAEKGSENFGADIEYGDTHFVLFMKL